MKAVFDTTRRLRGAPRSVWMLPVLGILCLSCSGADADPCEVLSAADVAAVLRVDHVVATESPLRGAGRICGYGFSGGPGSDSQAAGSRVISLFVSDIATYADFDRDAELRPGDREIRLAGADRVTISTADGGSGSASVVRGDRTANLHLLDAGLSVQEQQRILEELASRVVDYWLGMDG